MNVENILRTKGSTVETLPPDRSVAELCRALDEVGVGALVISADGTTIEGIVSERDVIGHLAQHGAGILDRPVSDIMQRDVVTCSCGDDIAHLMDTMTDRRIRHLPVVEGGRMAGIVSIGDVVKERIRESEREATDLRAYITAG